MQGGSTLGVLQHGLQHMQKALETAHDTEMQARRELAAAHEELDALEVEADRLRQQHAVDIEDRVFADDWFEDVHRRLEASQESETKLTKRASTSSKTARRLATELEAKSVELEAALKIALPGSGGTVTLEKHRDVVSKLTNLRRAATLTPTEHRKLLKEVLPTQADTTGQLSVLKFFDPENQISASSMSTIQKAHAATDTGDSVGKDRVDRYVKHTLDAIKAS